MRRLLGAYQRRAAALLLDPPRQPQSRRQDRHHRGPFAQRLASHPESLGRARRAAMRLLPVRTDHGGRGFAQEEPQADRPGHRSGDDQYLPLRHLPAHSRRRASRGRPAQWQPRGGSRHQQVLREAAMTIKIPANMSAGSTKSGKPKPKVSRRGFVVGSAAATGGLALGFHLPFGIGAADAQSAAGTEVNAWVVVQPDNTCVIRVARSEMGQGTITGLVQLVGEELDCDWKKVKAERVTPGQNLARKRVWGEMGTGGSRGIRTSQDYVRRGGAAARMMLMQAAADQWKVPVGELTVADGVITHAPSGRKTSYGRVAPSAAKLTPPDPKSIKLKDPKDWKVAGKPLKRLDTANKLNGSQVYSIDLKLPGMLHAAIKQSPVFGGKLASFDESKIAGMPGVKRALKVNDGAVAVVADTWWRAKKALDALPIVWDEGAGAKESSQTIAERLQSGLAATDEPFAGWKEGDALN